MTTKAKNGTWSPRRLREQLGFEVRDWARLLNVSPKTVERWEDGTAPAGLATEVFRGFAAALDAGVPPTEIHNRLNLGLSAFLAHGLRQGISR